MNKIVKSYLLAQLAEIDDELNEAECKYNSLLLLFSKLNSFQLNY
jgi:hypothetical protein